MKTTVICFFTALALLASAPVVSADVADVVAGKDNTLYEDAAGALSNGAGNYLFTGVTGQVKARRAVLYFDIAGNIPAGSTINSVALRMELSRTITGPQQVDLHVVAQDWGEGASNAGGQEGAGAPSAAGDATWIHTFFNGSFWVSPGGDFGPVPSASLVVDGLGNYQWASAQMTADVQAWLDNPVTNFGWLAKNADEVASGNTKRFNSRANTFQPPSLRIIFTPPPVSVESKTWGAIKALYDK